MKQEQASAPDPLEVKAVRDTLLSLSKVIKASRLYPPDSPAYQKLFQDYVNNLTSFLQNRGVMTWDLGQFHIAYEGQTVYDNRDLSESLAFHLYKDGIRQLRFHQGIQLSEIHEFMEILRCRFLQPDADDDVATLFWEKDFPNIQSLVVDISASGEEEVEEFDFSSHSQQLLEHGRKELESSLQIPSQDAEPAASSPLRADMLPIFSLGEEEIERVKLEILEEGEKDLDQALIDLLTEILSAKEEIEGTKESLAIVERITDSYCLQGEFYKAFNNLRLLRRLLDSSLDLPDSRRSSIREAIDRMGSPEKLRGLTKVLNQVDEEGLLAFQSYVYFLGPQTIAPLCEILGELKQMKARRILCEAIAKMSQGQVDRLGPAIKGPRWYVVRNVAYILGLMKDPQGVRYLKELVKHEEPRVKKEAIRALGTIGNSESRDYLLSCLKSPDVLIQTLAARALATLREKRALPLLLKIIEQKEFLNRDREEKKAIFEAIGQLGSDQLLPLLEKILLTKGIFQRSKIEEMREGAAHALALIGTGSARKILEEGAKGKDRAIEQVCRAALSQLSHFPMRARKEDQG